MVMYVYTYFYKHTVEIISFIDMDALLPVALSCKRLLDGVRVLLKIHKLSLMSNAKYFITSIHTAAWGMDMGCDINVIFSNAIT